MTMMGYLASLKAMYIDLSGKLGGGIEGCAWVNLMKHYNVEVWRAARLLARDRWRRFEGIDWHGGVTHFYPDGRYTYKDGATGANLFNILTFSLKSENLFCGKI